MKTILNKIKRYLTRCPKCGSSNFNDCDRGSYCEDCEYFVNY